MIETLGACNNAVCYFQIYNNFQYNELFRSQQNPPRVVCSNSAQTLSTVASAAICLETVPFQRRTCIRDVPNILELCRFYCRHLLHEEAASSSNLRIFLRGRLVYQQVYGHRDTRNVNIGFTICPMGSTYRRINL